MNAAHHAQDSPASAAVRVLIERARAAQAVANDYDQQRVDDLVAAAGWAILEPTRNRELAELAVADTGIGNVARQDPQESSQDARPAARPEGCAFGRRDRRVSGTWSDRDRAAGRRRGRDHAVDESRSHACEQDHQRAEGAQRGHRCAVAEGLVDLRAAARVRTCRVRPHRGAARPRAVAVRAGDEDRDRRADAAGRPGRGDRLAGQRARGLRERDAGLRRRRRQRRVDRRRDCGPRGGRGADPAVEDLRQRDQLLVREQRRAARRDPRCGAGGAAARWGGDARCGGPRAAAAVHVAGRQACRGGDRPGGGRDRGPARGSRRRRRSRRGRCLSRRMGSAPSTRSRARS